MPNGLFDPPTSAQAQQELSVRRLIAEEFYPALSHPSGSSVVYIFVSLSLVRSVPSPRLISLPRGSRDPLLLDHASSLHAFVFPLSPAGLAFK